jgi:50S ribosome-binding GTPase/Domain of unknown function (DUF3482)
MTTITLSLVSHTNVGKTTLARTLLGRDIGEVRDAPHVTEWAAMHVLIETGSANVLENSLRDQLRLWDTPGFGDSARLLRRMRQSGQPLGWLLSQVWDRWRDRAFWASQQALHHVQAESDVVLYLVNAAESPAGAGHVAAEMDLLAWLGKPVLVLLNQLGAPRAAAEEAAETHLWRVHLAKWPLVQAVLPMDAFARCWVHEATLLNAVQQTLTNEKSQAMQRLAQAWSAARQARFVAAMQVLAHSQARLALAKEVLDENSGWSERLRRLGAALGQQASEGPAEAAQEKLAKAGAEDARNSTEQLLKLHGLGGQVQADILQRVQGQFTQRARVSEGRAALWGGAVTGAVAGLKADILSGGLTMGGGLLAGGLLGALGAAGVARGINIVRGSEQNHVAFSDEALHAAAEAALLRYLAVAHFGRGRGEWAQGEAPAHWGQTVARALAPQREAMAAAWHAQRQVQAAQAAQPAQAAQGSQGSQASQASQAAQAAGAVDTAARSATLAQALLPLLQNAARQALRELYPTAQID